MLQLGSLGNGNFTRHVAVVFGRNSLFCCGGYVDLIYLLEGVSMGFVIFRVN